MGGARDWPLLKNVFETFESIGFENFMSSMFNTDKRDIADMWAQMLEAHPPKDEEQEGAMEEKYK